MRILGKFGKNKETEISTGISRNSVPFPDEHVETQSFEIDVRNDTLTLTDKESGKFISTDAYGESANRIAEIVKNCDDIFDAVSHFEDTVILNPFQKDENINNIENIENEVKVESKTKLPNLEMPKGPQQITPTPNFNFKPIKNYKTNEMTENTPLIFKYYDPQDGHLSKEKQTIQETKKYIVSHWLDHTENNIGDSEFDSAIGWMNDAIEVLKMDSRDFFENVLKNNTYDYQPLEDIGLTYFDVFEPTLKIEQIGNSHLELTDKNGELLTLPIEKLEKAGISVEQVKEIVETTETLSEVYFEITEGKEELANLVDLSSNSSNSSKKVHDDIDFEK